MALFGVQFLTSEGQQCYEASGIQEEMMPALGQAQAAGLLLHNCMLTSEEWPALMQYWRSCEDLDQWAHRLPHRQWWRWLVEHAGIDLGFYHPIHQPRAADAFYTGEYRPAEPVVMGEGVVEGASGARRGCGRGGSEVTHAIA